MYEMRTSNYLCEISQDREISGQRDTCKAYGHFLKDN